MAKFPAVSNLFSAPRPRDLRFPAFIARGATRNFRVAPVSPIASRTFLLTSRMAAGIFLPPFANGILAELE
jgi:hypothetical protein